MEFGEAVMWKRRPQGGPLGKLSCLWSDGIHLEDEGSMGEYIVGGGDGSSGTQGESCCADDFLQPGDQGETRGARR